MAVLQEPLRAYGVLLLWDNSRLQLAVQPRGKVHSPRISAAETFPHPPARGVSAGAYVALQHGGERDAVACMQLLALYHAPV